VVIAGTVLSPRMLSSTRQVMLEATDIRNIAGLLTIEETADWYGIDVELIKNAVDAEEVGHRAIHVPGELALLPTHGRRRRGVAGGAARLTRDTQRTPSAARDCGGRSWACSSSNENPAGYRVVSPLRWSSS